MITESEFVIICQFDRTLDRVVGEADRMIAGKNRELGSAGRIIRHLQSQVDAANARAAAAEARTASLLKQIQATLN